MASEPPMIPPPMRMMQLTTGAWVSQAISVVATLGVADELAAGPRQVDDVAEAVDAHAPTLYRVLRALADVEVFRELPGRRFELTPLGELLRSDVPGSMRLLATMFSLPFDRDSWSDLLGTVQTGEPAFERVHGQTFWDYLRDRPDVAEVVNAVMTTLSEQQIAAIVDRYDFSSFGTIVDVGGGHGGLLAAILTANPDLRGVLYDQPDVIAGAGGPLEKAGVSHRCEHLSGNFFDAVPSGGDAYLLSNIVHDWSDERAVRILANCRTALGDGDGGCVLLAEIVLPDQIEPSQAKLMDLEIMVLTEGRQRTAAEFDELFRQAGLRLSRVVPSGIYSVVEATPA